MPSVSDKQRRFMAAAANNPKFAKKAGIKQSVAKEFHNADRFAMGGTTMGALTGLAKSRLNMFNGGGLSQAMMQQQGGFNKNMPQGRMGPQRQVPPPRMPYGKQPSQLQSGPKLGPPPGAPNGRMPPRRVPPAGNPRLGGLGRYAATRAGSGPARRPQLPQAGRPRFAGNPASRAPNALLRTSQAASDRAGNMLNRMSRQPVMGRMRPRFAKGGKVSRAISALDSARDWLIHSSDEPDFIRAKADLKGIPNAEALKRKINSLQKKWDSDAMSAEDIRKEFIRINSQFDRLKSQLSSQSD